MLLAETSTNHDRLNTRLQSINLRQAISKTFEHNPSLKSFSYQLNVQQGRERQAGMSASPEFNVIVEDVLGSGRFKGADSAQFTFNIGWVLRG